MSSSLMRHIAPFTLASCQYSSPPLWAAPQGEGGNEPNSFFCLNEQITHPNQEQICCEKKPSQLNGCADGVSGTQDDPCCGGCQTLTFPSSNSGGNTHTECIGPLLQEGDKCYQGVNRMCGNGMICGRWSDTTCAQRGHGSFGYCPSFGNGDCIEGCHPPSSYVDYQCCSCVDGDCDKNNYINGVYWCRNEIGEACKVDNNCVAGAVCAGGTCT